MNEDKIVQKLIEHDKKFDELVTKGEFKQFKEEMLSGQDRMLQILERLDQERIFTNEAIKRLEKDVEEGKARMNEFDIQLNKIKTQLNIA